MLHDERNSSVLSHSLFSPRSGGKQQQNTVTVICNSPHLSKKPLVLIPCLGMCMLQLALLRLLSSKLCESCVRPSTNNNGLLLNKVWLRKRESKKTRTRSRRWLWLKGEMSGWLELDTLFCVKQIFEGPLFFCFISELNAGDWWGGRRGCHLHHHAEEGAASPVGQQGAAMAGRGDGLRPEPLRDLQGADHQGRHAGEAGGVHGDGLQGQRLHLRHHLPLHLSILRLHQAGAGSPAQQVQQASRRKIRSFSFFSTMQLLIYTMKQNNIKVARCQNWAVSFFMKYSLVSGMPSFKMCLQLQLTESPRTTAQSWESKSITKLRWPCLSPPGKYCEMCVGGGSVWSSWKIENTVFNSLYAV